MKKNATLFALLALLMLAAFDINASAQCSVAGQITDYWTGSPVSGVEIQMYDSNNNLVATDTTDSNGNYVLTSNQTGQHAVQTVTTQYYEYRYVNNTPPSYVGTFLQFVTCGLSTNITQNWKAVHNDVTLTGEVIGLSQYINGRTIIADPNNGGTSLRLATSNSSGNFGITLDCTLTYTISVDSAPGETVWATNSGGSGSTYTNITCQDVDTIVLDFQVSR